MDTTGRTPQRLARRRDEILDTAMDLFAKEGIASASMSQVAKAAGVSPGNLYYWFHSMAELVRHLFDRWTDESAMTLPAETEPSQMLVELWSGLASQVDLADRWSFFARDLFPLLHADPDLAAQYAQNYAARVDQLCALVHGLVDAGLLHSPIHEPLTDEPRTDEPRTGQGDPTRPFVQAVWLLVETGGAFGRLVPGFELRPAVQAVVAPLVTPAGWEILDQARADA